MLYITRDDLDAHNVLLALQGRISAEWADLLEQECRELRAFGLRVALDLSGVVFISRPGVEALGRLGQSGVAITGCSPLVAAMLRQEGIVAELAQ